MKHHTPISRRIAGALFTKLIPVLSACFLSVCTPPQPAIPAAPDPADWNITRQCTALGKSMNLGNALEAPTEGKWGVILEEAYFSHVKSLGFNSVRIPVRWSAHVDSIAPYSIDKIFFERVLWAIEQALGNGLRAIVNVHHFEDLMSNPDKYEPVFLSIWQQVADRCTSYGPELYFELCNEPNGVMTAERWNTLAKKALAIVRTSNPKRSVLIGSVNWNHANALAELVLPPDSFLIATFHCYEPAPFTHQGASWVAGADMWKGIRWRASRTDTTLLTSLFARVNAWATEKNIPVYLGEFGALDTADTVSRVLYTSFIAKQALQRGWSYAYWKYNNNFGIYDDESSVTRNYLVNALLKPDSTFAAWQKIAAADTTSPALPDSSRPFLLLDDFDDTLPRQSALVNCHLLFTDTTVPPPESCCFWNCWYSSGSMMKNGNNSAIGHGNAGVMSLIGPWGKNGNGFHVKGYLNGTDYPSLNFTTELPSHKVADSNSETTFYNFSSLEAISFYAKGFGAWTIDIITDTIQNHYPPSDNWGNFSCTFEPSDSWRLYVFKTDQFKPKPWSKPQQDMLTWSDGMNNVAAITFSNGQNYGKIANDSLEIFIDDIRLWGLSCDSLHRSE